MWRSVLFVPALQERFVTKAHERGADAIILDLEASIAAERKAEARAALPGAVATLAERDQTVLVRINMLWRAALADLEVAIAKDVAALVLPGCDTPEEVRAVNAIMAETEEAKGLRAGGIQLIPIVETAKGVCNAEAIAGASPRVAAIAFGVEDFVTDMRIGLDPAILEETAATVARAARAAGKDAYCLPASLADITDMDAFAEAARRGRAIGSAGGFAVHPDQVRVLNDVFRPTPEEIAWARRVLEAAETMSREGSGAVSRDGRMIDLPIIRRARTILDAAAP